MSSKTEICCSTPNNNPTPIGQPLKSILLTNNLNENSKVAEVIQENSNLVYEMVQDTWADLGEENEMMNNSVTSMQYIDTNVGHRSESETGGQGHLKVYPKNPDAGIFIHESNCNTVFKFTESMGSIYGSVSGEIDDSVTSFSSFYEEIRNCDDDVDKIRKLLELDQKSSEDDTREKDRDRSNNALLGSIFDSKKKSNKVSGSLHSKTSNTTNKIGTSGKDKQRQAKRSSSPNNRRKIIVCDGKVGLVGYDDLNCTRDKSPYKCEFFDTKTKPPKGKSYQEVYVTEKEYRLIQSFIPPPQTNNPQTQIMTQEASECQRTLFGWVAFGSIPIPPATVANSDTKSSTTVSVGQIPLQFCRSRSRLGQFTTVSDTNLQHKASCPIPKPQDNKGTQTVKKAVEFTDQNTIVTYEPEPDSDDENIPSSPVEYEQGQDLFTSNNHNNNVEEDMKNININIKSLYNALLDYEDKLAESPKNEITINPTTTADSNPISRRLDRMSLETIGRSMCSDVFTASETSVILINTVFKDIVLSSDVSASLSFSPKFQDFINSVNEMDALEKAAEIYVSTAEKIREYLESVKSRHIPRKKVTGHNENRKDTADAHVLKQTDITSEEFAVSLERQGSNLANIWSFVPELCPQNFEVSLTSRPGILMEKIECNKSTFFLTYTGGHERVNLIETATREKSEPVFLSPQLLLEMIDRNSSLASGRLTTCRYYMKSVVEKITESVQDFLFGKYAKPESNFTTRLINKYRKLNVFSGILFQMSVSFLHVCKRIQCSIEKAMKLDDVLICPRLPGLKLIMEVNNDPKQHEMPKGSEMPMKEAIEDLSKCIEEIDSIIISGKNSLISISGGVQAKKSHKNTIRIMCDAVKQLEFNHEIDFGAVIMSLACNSAVIQSLSDFVPTVDIDVRSRILSNLGHLNWGAGEVVNLSKRISLLSSFVAGKSFAKLTKSNQIQAAKKRKQKQRKGQN